MMRRRRAIGTIVIVVAVLVVVIVGTAAFVVVNSETSFERTASTGSPSLGTSSATSSSGYAETTSTESSSGIQLEVSVNTTTVVVGGRLNIDVGLFNTLSESNNVSTADDWTIQGFPIAIWGPCAFDLPVGFVVVSGNYNGAQLEQMTVNASQAEVGYVCMEGSSVKFIDFQPDSSQANLTGTLIISGEVPHQSLGSFNLESNFSVSGYWDYPLTAHDSGDLLTPAGSGGISFQYPEVSPLTSYAFLPGAYTLAVADEWGQTVIIHFAVVATSTATASCVQLESEPLFLTIRNSTSGSPIPSIQVQVQESTPTDLCSSSSPKTTENLGVMSTDINGTIEVCCTGSTFSFSIPYLAGSPFGGSYQSTANGAESVECVTLYLPSGVMGTTYAPQFQDHC